MAKRQIIIYLEQPHPRPEDEVSWVVVEPGQRPGAVFRGDLKTAANHAHGCKVVIMVPAADILITDVQLPNMNRQRLLRAIPFALEETVATDLEDMHFAIGQRYDSGELAIAGVDKEKVGAWSTTLKNVGLHADLLVSDIYGLPYEEQTWTVFVTGQDADSPVMLRMDEQMGMGLEFQNLVALLTLALAQRETELRPARLQVIFQEDLDSELIDADTIDQVLAEDETLKTSALEFTDEMPGASAEEAGTPAAAGETLSVLSAKQTLDQVRTLCEQYEVEVEVREHDESMLAYLAQHYTDGIHINLLQGEFSRKEQLEKLFRPWLPAAAVAATWLLLQGGLFIADYQALSSKEQQLRQQVVAIFKEAFPQAKVVDPKKQMEGELKKLKSNTGTSKTGFIPLLHQAGGILNKTKTLNIKGMRYKGNKLDLDLEISDLAALDELKSRLINDAELKVEIVSASSREGKVDSRIQIQPKA